ncbi:MBL fold metallo-hydrolase [Xenorhabdus griffiniae]|uniref:MBL fold metallo-hydrolase n=1 Tax=Xenorhabdus griffiniae TaxID=351672 RepID=A0ABY9XH18_9GAMM|nr:MBL fold metallo-hydrolase [Xenorhabdus griffiniae]MBD1228139.1 MBL fold metallo-hydrolase [Xenorhabdus griffiniae]MBE8588477.1 MBL fold metallo-hydrolase [Xenorhabdus griffiniae]WMV72131.1 MBL fold metallo-hydrolase [Xenorhabdus griffiniae]WNH01809.1 MBL fold metallo-hydrolase [Xenorhabdus griffiniae]
MVKIRVFNVGYCTHSGCMALKGASLRVCKFPARAWLLECHDKRWLLDTGYANHFYDHTRSGIIRLYRTVTPVYFDSKDALVMQLKGEDIQARDIDGIIISHFHGDHIAGLRDFPQAKFICSGEGWRQTRHLRGIAALRKAFVRGLMPEDFESRVSFYEGFEASPLPEELSVLGKGYAVPGSQKQILIVPLPGHAAGHLGLCVLSDQGWILLAGDAAWSPTNYRELRGPAKLANLIMDDSRAYYETLNKLHHIDQKQIPIQLCHEGDLE